MAKNMLKVECQGLGSDGSDDLWAAWYTGWPVQAALGATPKAAMDGLPALLQRFTEQGGDTDQLLFESDEEAA